MPKRFTYYNSGVTGFDFLLDNYSDAEVAYSLRKLSSSYSGSCIRVRRDSDNTEQDIGFDNNVLDTTSLSNFVGSGSGYVTIWYDQVGSSNNVIQNTITEQPMIVNSGVINTENGKPSIKFQINSSLNFINQLNGLTAHLYSVFSSGESLRFSLIGGSNVYIPLGQNGSSSTETIRIPNLTNQVSFWRNGQNIDSQITNRGDVFQKYVSSIGQNLIGLNNLLLDDVNRLGWGSNQVYRLNGSFQELIFFNDSTNRISIENNINSYYGIY